ncbi:hypothetical protein DAT1711_07940 [Enterococcus cecorum]
MINEIPFCALGKNSKVTPNEFNLFLPIATSCFTKLSPTIPLDKLTIPICIVKTPLIVKKRESPSRPSLFSTNIF